MYPTCKIYPSTLKLTPQIRAEETLSCIKEGIFISKKRLSTRSVSCFIKSSMVFTSRLAVNTSPCLATLCLDFTCFVINPSARHYSSFGLTIASNTIVVVSRKCEEIYCILSFSRYFTEIVKLVIPDFCRKFLTTAKGDDILYT